jgi:hypothetical protein
MLGDEQRKLPSEEPIGIVISRGAVLDVWAAVKDVETVPAADTR